MKKILAIIIALALCMSILPMAMAATTWYVAGSFTSWADNKMPMTQNGDVWTVTVDLPVGEHQYKIMDGGSTWLGDASGNNLTVNVTSACSVTFTYNASTGEIKATGSGIGAVSSKLEYTAVFAVGNGSGNWLNGASWDAGAASNKMTQTSTDVWEATFKNVPAGNGYNVKFAIDGSWTHNFGCADKSVEAVAGTTYDAVYNGQDIWFKVTYDVADVTVKLDLSGYDHATKSGAKFSIKVTEVNVTPPPTDKTYIVAGVAGLCGSEWNAEDTNNQLVKNADGSVYSKTYTVEPGLYAFKVTTGSWSSSYPSKNYMFYADAAGEITISVVAATNAVSVSGNVIKGVFVVAGSETLCGSNWDTWDANNIMQLNKDGSYSLTFKDVAAGTYELKVVEWNDEKWHGDAQGNNVSVTAKKGDTIVVKFDANTGIASAAVDVPENGDFTSVVVALLAISAMGITVLAKKKEF